MAEQIMNDTEELEMTTDQALISALQVKKVGELELQPFSLMRQLFSVDLCRKSRNRIFDAVVTVWTCTLSEAEVLEAWEDIPQARLRAFDWAELQGYSIMNYEPLLAVYARLNRELMASAGARIKGGLSEDGAKNDGGPAAP
jgi:hypothetical protein